MTGSTTLWKENELMIQTELFEFEGRTLRRTFFQHRTNDTQNRNRRVYSEAVDVPGCNGSMEETGEPIEDEEPTTEQMAEALNILGATV